MSLLYVSAAIGIAAILTGAAVATGAAYATTRIVRARRKP